MRSLNQGALLKPLAFGFSLMGGALISLSAFAQAQQIIAQVEPITIEVEPLLDASPNSELDEDMIAEGNIADVAMASDSFETLITALETAGLATMLSGGGPYTIFAPTDEAFAALPEGAVEKLLMPESREVLAQILTYHVVPGELTAADLVSGSVATVEGSEVTVAIEETVKVNEATVITPDIPASNGIIHAIDRVIMPPALFAATIESEAAL